MLRLKTPSRTFLIQILLFSKDNKKLLQTNKLQALCLMIISLHRMSRNFPHRTKVVNSPNLINHLSSKFLIKIRRAKHWYRERFRTNKTYKILKSQKVHKAVNNKIPISNKNNLVIRKLLKIQLPIMLQLESKIAKVSSCLLVKLGLNNNKISRIVTSNKQLTTRQINKIHSRLAPWMR